MSSPVLAPKHFPLYDARMAKRKLPKVVADALKRLGREGGKKRAKLLTKKRRHEIASAAAEARWGQVKKGKA